MTAPENGIDARDSFSDHPGAESTPAPKEPRKYPGVAGPDEPPL